MVFRSWSSALFLLLAFHAAHSQSYCVPDSTAFFQSNSLMGVALMISVTIIALAYFASQLTHNERLSVWAKDELVQLGISAGLIICVIGLFSAGCASVGGYATSFAPDGVRGDTFQVSYHYLDSLISRSGLATGKALVKSSIDYQLMATDYKFIGVPITGGCGIAKKANMKSISQQKELLFDMMMPAIASLSVQKNLLNMIQLTGYSLLLPLAVLLRILPFTREIGNFLISLSFGLYVMLPALYAINYYATANFLGPNLNRSLEILPTAGIAYQVGGGTLYNDFNNVGVLIPQAIFLPNLAIVILISFVQGFSKALKSIEAIV